MRRMILVTLALALLAACAPEDRPAAGRAAFEANCAGCHGTDAQGAFAGVPDLTRLASRAGGQFPMALVLRRVDGYARGLNEPPSTMPEMGHLLDGRLVRVDLGDGRTTMTPAALAAIAGHLRDLQR